jgi:hypothetical protein
MNNGASKIPSTVQILELLVSLYARQTGTKITSKYIGVKK